MDVNRAPNPHRQLDAKKLPKQKTNCSTPFVYVDAVDLAPMFVRREVFRSLGGFLREFSEAGEAAGGWLDIELCLRAWLAGWRVGLYPTRFQRWVGGRGTDKYGGSKIRYSNHDRNRDITLDIHEHNIGQIRLAVELANEELDPDLVRAANKIFQQGKNRWRLGGGPSVRSTRLINN
jgi:hypothetical protein